MVVRKLAMMPIHFYALLLLPVFLLHCGGPATVLPLSELDYAEVENHTGWTLRLHGDGSGSLSHEQLPTYHLHYPSHTFDASPARSLVQRCKGKKEAPVCVLVRFYSSTEDVTKICRCASGSWPGDIMEQAISQMQRAVDAGASERSCRMLRRRWLASR